jgi:hypothetical protein
MASNLPHCPACAAPLPIIGAAEIVTCDACGTDSNARQEPIPGRPLRSPPLSRRGRAFMGGGHQRFDHERLPDDDLGPFAHAHFPNWEFGVVVYYLLTDPDPARRLIMARTSGVPVWDRDALTWAPALADEVIRAAREGQHELAEAVALLVRDLAAGETVRIPDSPDQGRRPDLLDWCFQVTGLIRRREDSRSARVMLELSARIERACPGSREALIVLSGAGAAAIKRLVELATAAADAGDDARAAHLVRLLGFLFTHLGEHWQDPRNLERFGRQLDVAFHLIMTGREPARRALIDAIADLADRRIDGEKPGPRDWRGPCDVLIPLLVFAEDMLHERPALGREFLDAIVAAYSDRPRAFGHNDRWRDAVAALQSPDGRAAGVAAWHRIAGPPGSKFAMERVIDLAAELPPLSEPVAPPGDARARQSVPLAHPRAGQAPCPACGRALGLKSGLLVTTCEYCGQRARIAREVRVVLEDAAEGDMSRWSPERLLRTILQSTDEDLRLAAAYEMDSPTSDGARYVEFAPLLIDLLRKEQPEELRWAMQRAIDRLLSHDDPDFKAAMVEAFRLRGGGRAGSPELPKALGKVGPLALPVLLNLVDQNTKGGGELGPYTQAALSEAMRLVAVSLEPGQEEHVRWALERALTAGEALAAEIASAVAWNVLHEKPFTPAQACLVRYIDEHVDPARIKYETRLGRRQERMRHPKYPERLKRHKPRAEPPVDRNIRLLLGSVRYWRSDRGVRPDCIVQRLRLLETLRTDAARLVVLNSLTSRTHGLDGRNWREVRRRLRLCMAGDDLAPSVRNALFVLRPAPPWTKAWRRINRAVRRRP